MGAEKAGPVIRTPLANATHVRGGQSVAFRCILNPFTHGVGCSRRRVCYHRGSETSSSWAQTCWLL